MLPISSFLRTHRLLSYSAALALVACGGGEPTVADAADDARVEAAAVMPVLIVSPSIGRPPQDATVAAGTGTRFSVLASGIQPLSYRWSRDGLPIPGAAGAGSYYDLPVASPGPVSTYSVRVTDRFGNAVTASATLTVISNDWAQIGGRAIFSSSAPQQPSLTMCNGPVLAWIDTGTSGAGTLRVSRFAGTAWQQMGGVLNVAASADAAEPSIDCLEWNTTRRPVVAWSESNGIGRTIVVKSWDGSAWVSLAGVGTSDGAIARKPVLRLASDRAEAAVPLMRVRSALAWVENGFARAKLWNGIAWQPLAGGFPSGSGLSDLALALDRSITTPGLGLFEHPPLVASVTALPMGSSAVSAQANRAGWAAFGQSPSARSPATAAKRIAGIGFSSDNSGLGHIGTAVWFDSTAAGYTISSSALIGGAYHTALTMPLAPPPAWGSFANPLSGADLHAWSFDVHDVPSQCNDGSRRPTFAMAVNDRRGTSVLLAACQRNEADPLVWTPVSRTLPGQASGLSLRMVAADGLNTPTLAVSQLAGARHELSVWQSYR